MSDEPEWKIYGHSLSTGPTAVELVTAELRHNKIEGEFRFREPDKDGFYAIEIRRRAALSPEQP